MSLRELAVRFDLQQAVLIGPQQQLLAAVHVELPENTGEVMADGDAGNTEPFGNVLIRGAWPIRQTISRSRPVNEVSGDVAERRGGGSSSMDGSVHCKSAARPLFIQGCGVGEAADVADGSEQYHRRLNGQDNAVDSDETDPTMWALSSMLLRRMMRVLGTEVFT